ncbi:hypothetical protein [Nocardiopsis rhodophaea]|uniref:TPR repeat region-containing protein n=1 Tax=Nocardiopsis rhodophaea TaxID=280238 RepID=UPI0031D7AC7E
MSDDLSSHNSTARDTFGLSFNPKDTEAEYSTIMDAADGITDIAVRTLGRSTDLKDDFDKLAMDYTHVIGAQIRNQGDGNEGMWRQASYAVNYCAGETRSWAAEVKDFKKKRNNLIKEWGDAVKAAVDKVQSDSPGSHSLLMGGVFDKKEYKLAKKELSGKLEELNDRASNDWKKFKQKAEDYGDNLKEGPTPENVKRLVDAGHIGWSAYNIKGRGEPLPLKPKDAAKLARTLDKYLGPDGKEPDQAYQNALLTLQIVGGYNSVVYDNPIHKVQASSYLERFYSELDEKDGGLLRYLKKGIEDSSLNNEEKAQLAGALGEGLLTLSSEDHGGGWSRLPESMQRVAEGPALSGEPPKPYHHIAWKQDLDGLAYLLESTDGRAVPGSSFSTTMTSTLGRVLYEANSDASSGPDGVIPELTPRSLDGPAKTILGFTLENEDANYAILATPDPGKGEPGHGHYHRDDIIKGLFGHNWSDDGRTVSKLINWIPENADSQVSWKRDHAGEAAYGLIEALADKEVAEALRNVDNSIKGEDKTAFTEQNNELAGNLTKIYIAYIDDFTLEVESGDKAGYVEVPEDERSEGFPLHTPGEKAMFIPESSQNNFLRFLVTNDKLAPTVLAATEAEEQRIFEKYLTGEGRITATADSAASLRGVVDGAMLDEYIDEGREKKEAKKAAAKNWETAYAIVGGTASAAAGAAHPAAGAGVAILTELGKEPFKELVEDKLKEGEEEPDDDEINSMILGSDSDIQRHVMLQGTQILVNNGALSMETLDNAGLLVDQGGKPYLPAHAHEWGAGRSGKIDVLRDDVIDNIPSKDLNGLPEDIKKAIVDYKKAYQEQYDNPLVEKTIDDDKED